jgi:hypothetical protein
MESKNIGMKDILQNPKCLNWREVSEHAKITIQNILDHHELNWDWYYLSKNLNIPLTDILAHTGLPWDWSVVATSRKITMDDIFEQQ